MFYVPKALKDPDQVAQSDGEESPAAEEQLLGEVLIFLYSIGQLCDNCVSHLKIRTFSDYLLPVMSDCIAFSGVFREILTEVSRHTGSLAQLLDCMA